MRRSDLAPAFAVFVAGKLAVNTATRFVYAFLPAIARGLGVSLAAAGALASVRWAVGAATPAVVRVAGREHRRRILFAGLGLFAAGALVTAATGVYAGAMVGFVLMGLGKPVFDSGTQAYVADRVPYERRARALGVLETTWALSFLVGAPAAGWLIDAFGWSVPFWVATIAVLLMLGVVARLTKEDGGEPDGGEPDGGKSGTVAPLAWDRTVRNFLVATALIVGSVEMVFITFAAWLERSHGFTIAGLAVLATAIGVGELAAEAATVAITDRLGKRRSVALGLAISVAAYVTMMVAGGSTAVAVAALVVGIAGFEFAFVSSIPLATELRPQARIRLLSRFVVAQAGGRGVAAAIAVALFEAAGMAGVALTAAATAAAAAVVVLAGVREHEVVGGGA